MSNPIFLIVTSNGCQHCTQFKKNILGSLKDQLQNDNQVEVVELNLESTNSELPSEYPSDLRRYINWYPTFLLFSRDSWYRAYDEGVLKGLVFNGVVDNDQAKARLVGNKSINKNNIVSWIKNNLSSLP